MFHDRWREMLRRAGIEVHHRNGPQKVRRTSATYVEKAQPGAGRHHLGHLTVGLAEKHYIDPKIARPPKIMPPAFDEIDGGKEGDE